MVESVDHRDKTSFAVYTNIPDASTFARTNLLFVTCATVTLIWTYHGFDSKFRRKIYTFLCVSCSFHREIFADTNHKLNFTNQCTKLEQSVSRPEHPFP